MPCAKLFFCANVVVLEPFALSLPKGFDKLSPNGTAPSPTGTALSPYSIATSQRKAPNF